MLLIQRLSSRLGCAARISSRAQLGYRVSHPVYPPLSRCVLQPLVSSLASSFSSSSSSSPANNIPPKLLPKWHPHSLTRKNLIRLPPYMNVKELGERCKLTQMEVNRIGQALFAWWPRVSRKFLKKTGFMVLRQITLNYDEAAKIVHKAFNGRKTTSLEEWTETDLKSSSERVQPKVPIISILGHVDHGKTTLLDSLRGGNIADKEDAKITQEVYTFSVDIDGTKQDPDSSSSLRTCLPVTFLDTPGHQNFMDMRANGVFFADLVLLVVAADEGVRNQTRESLELAKEYGAPVLVVINKIDAPGANVELVKQQLSEFGGFDLQPVDTSLSPLAERMVSSSSSSSNPSSSSSASSSSSLSLASSSSSCSSPAAPRPSALSSFADARRIIEAEESDDEVNVQSEQQQSETERPVFYYVEVSAKQRQNLDILKDSIVNILSLINSETDVDAVPHGAVLETFKEEGGRGSVMKVVLTRGTLYPGQSFVAGMFSGRVKGIYSLPLSNINSQSPAALPPSKSSKSSKSASSSKRQAAANDNSASHQSIHSNTRSDLGSRILPYAVPGVVVEVMGVEGGLPPTGAEFSVCSPKMALAVSKARQLELAYHSQPRVADADLDGSGDIRVVVDEEEEGGEMVDEEGMSDEGEWSEDQVDVDMGVIPTKKKGAELELGGDVFSHPIQLTKDHDTNAAALSFTDSMTVIEEFYSSEAPSEDVSDADAPSSSSAPDTTHPPRSTSLLRSSSPPPSSLSQEALNLQQSLERQQAEQEEQEILLHPHVVVKHIVLKAQNMGALDMLNDSIKRHNQAVKRVIGRLIQDGYTGEAVSQSESKDNLSPFQARVVALLQEDPDILDGLIMHTATEDGADAVAYEDNDPTTAKVDVTKLNKLVYVELAASSVGRTTPDDVFTASATARGQTIFEDEARQHGYAPGEGRGSASSEFELPEWMSKLPERRRRARQRKSSNQHHGLILCFRVRPPVKAVAVKAKDLHVDIREYKVFHQLLNDLVDAR